jgi:hypothetical protein
MMMMMMMMARRLYGVELMFDASQASIMINLPHHSSAYRSRSSFRNVEERGAAISAVSWSSATGRKLPSHRREEKSGERGMMVNEDRGKMECEAME